LLELFGLWQFGKKSAVRVEAGAKSGKGPTNSFSPTGFGGIIATNEE
jgi:hypothetical protein